MIFLSFELFLDSLLVCFPLYPKLRTDRYVYGAPDKTLFTMVRSICLWVYRINFWLVFWACYLYKN